MKTLRLRDAADCRLAAGAAAEGLTLGLSAGSVCLILFDGARREAAEEVMRIKGEGRGPRPSTLALSARRLAPMLDGERMAPALRAVFLDPIELEDRLAALCLLRAPLRPGVSLPPAVASRSPDGGLWVQNWLPEKGNPLCPLLDALAGCGIDYPAVSSLNLSDEPEIVDQEEAAAFCEKRGIPFFLSDPERRYRPRGSFPILGLDLKGASLLREGHFAAEIFEKLLGAPVDRSRAASSKFDLIEIPSAIGESPLPPARLRRALISWLEGGEIGS
jgi:hypothetical protein